MNERTTECGFCRDGVFVLRARGDQPWREIRCPYCEPPTPAPEATP